MARKRFSISVMFFLVGAFLIFLFFYDDLTLAKESGEEERHFNIATIETRPLSIDRLLYTALKSMDYQTAFSVTSLVNGYGMANEGEYDGVISSYPDLQEEYDGLIKVPVQLEHIRTNIYVSSGKEMVVRNWSELSGLRVCLLPDRVYIRNQIPEDSEVVTKETVKLVLDGLVNGEYDVAILAERDHETFGNRNDVKKVGQIDEMEEYLYLHKSHEDLVPDIAEAIRGVMEDGRGEEILNDMPIPELTDKKTVLHIISSNMEISREDTFYKTLKETLKDDESIEWYSIALNSKRFSDDPYRLIYFAHLLRQDFLTRNVSAIIVSGEEAMEFLKEHYFHYFRNIPVLFYGVGEEYEKKMEDYKPYFTGVVERLSAFETISSALMLFPDTKKIYVVNDYLPEGEIYRTEIEKQLKSLKEGIQVEYNEDVDMETLLADIRGLPEDALVLVGSYFSDANGQYFTLSEMERLLGEHCNVPILSLYSMDVDYHAVGGKCLNYEKYAEMIADMLMRILNGESVGSIPILSDTEAYNQFTFDFNRMKEWGIRIKDLPEDARVTNRTPTIWESDPRFAYAMVAMLLLSVAVIVGLALFLREYRKRNRDLQETKKHLHTAEEMLQKDVKIKEVKERLERVINTAPVAFVMTVDGTIVEVNEYMKKHVGMEVGKKILPFYTNPEQRVCLFQKAEQQKVINETIRLNMANGETHRFLANVSTTRFDQQKAFMLWAVDIEDREKQTDELTSSKQKFQEIKERIERIIQTSPISYLMSIDGKVEEINESMRNEVGLDIGDDIGRIYTNPSESDALLERLYKEKRLTNEVIRFHMINGESHRFLVNLVLAEYEKKQAMIAWALDIENSEEQKDQLEIARLSLQKTMDTLPIPVSIVDDESLRMVYGNNAYLKLYGYESMEELAGRHIADTLAPVQDDGSDSKQLAEAVVHSSVPIKIELQMQTTKGRIVDTLVRTQPIDYFGKESTIGIMTDLTAEKEYQRLLRNTALKEKEANELKSRFLVNMSHEIRTPMNAIIGLTDIELHKNPPKEAVEVYKKVNLSAKNLLQIINDILDLSKIEADKIELFYEEFELEDVLNNALLVASPRLEAKNVEFMLNFSLDLPRYVIGDKTRVWQILKNFLDNAAKFTEKGKIVVDVFEESERSTNEEVAITFIIRDTGIGMSKEQLKKIFMPYKQFYNEAQRTYTGTGLGMPISKQLCELMGGKMEIESEVDVGTVIRVTIPFGRSDNEEREIQAIKSQPLADLKVLAVDDDDLSLQIMTTLLQGSNANCTKAHSGDEALKIIFEQRDRNEDFDLILLDYMMEGLNGLETARQIQTGLSRAPKLLMVTAYQRQLIMQELEENGIEDVLEKPFIPSQFIRKICKIMGFDEHLIDEKESYTIFKDVKVLLCEDYYLNQEVAVGMFRQFGIEPVVADDGKQGLDALYGDDAFDLIFMDLKMPVMDGYEATRRIRADSRFDKVPIVSLTADAMTEILDQCLEVGMNDHLTKPIEFDKLHEIFLKWLPESKRVQGGSGLEKKSGTSEEGLARFGGNKERYDEALAEFARALPDVWPDYDYVLGEGREEMKQNVHKWKGAAGNLSVMDVYQSAISFEDSMRNGVPDPKAYERLVLASKAFQNDVRMQNEPTDKDGKDVGFVGEWERLVKKLNEALSDYDPVSSKEIIESMKKKTWPNIDGEKLQQLFQLSLHYEFDAAIELLSNIDSTDEGGLMG